MSKTIQDEVLGTLTYHAMHNVFKGKVQFGNQSIEIDVVFDTKPDAVSASQVEAARTAYLQLVARKSKIEADFVEDVLYIYNEDWRHEEPILDEQQFLEAIKFDGILIERGHLRVISYFAGELFGGHWIDINLDDYGNVDGFNLSG